MILVVGTIVALFIGVPLAAVAVTVARMQDEGGHCAHRRPRAAVILALDLWAWLRTAEPPLPPEPCAPPAPATWDQISAGMGRPIVSDREVRAEFARMPLAPGSHPYPPLRPTVLARPDGAILIDEAERVHVRPGRGGPFTAVDMPAVPENDPRDYPHYYTDEIECGDCRREHELELVEDDPVPIARPWTAGQVAYGVASCQLDVAEAERRFALAMGPDGCEEIR